MRSVFNVLLAVLVGGVSIVLGGIAIDAYNNWTEGRVFPVTTIVDSNIGPVHVGLLEIRCVLRKEQGKDTCVIKVDSRETGKELAERFGFEQGESLAVRLRSEESRAFRSLRFADTQFSATMRWEVRTWQRSVAGSHRSLGMKRFG